MATWQFNSWLYPRNGGRGASNWSNEKQAKAVLEDIALILPELPHYWNQEGKAWGSHDSDIIEVGFDEGHLQEISFRVDLRKTDESFIKALVHLALRHDLLLLTEDNVALLPDLTTFVGALKDSKAARFLTDPLGYLNELEEIQ